MPKKLMVMDRQTDRPTDQPTDMADYRAACRLLKIQSPENKLHFLKNAAPDYMEQQIPTSLHLEAKTKYLLIGTNLVISHKLHERLFPSVRWSIFSRVLRDSTPRFVGPLVRWSVGPSVHHTFCGFLHYMASLLLPK